MLTAFVTGFFTVLGGIAAIAACMVAFSIVVGIPGYIWYRRKRETIKRWSEILRGLSNPTSPINFPRGGIQ
ncbi:MAG: hypothetical protein PVI03_03190 [Candidatus Thorarchaeota archaeon]|jgi:hypothetical protein